MNKPIRKYVWPFSGHQALMRPEAVVRLCSDKKVFLRPATLLKKRLLAMMFTCEFCKIFKNTYFQRTFSVTASNWPDWNSLKLHQDFFRKIKLVVMYQQNKGLKIKFPLHNFARYYSRNHCFQYPADTYLFKFNNRSSRKRCETCSK